MRRAFIAVSLLAAALAVTAGASGKSSAAVAIPGCATDSLKLVSAGTLTVGTDNPAYGPWFGGGEIKGSKWKINDPATGKGYESAVAYEVAKRLGFAKSELKWVAVPFNTSFRPGKKNFDFFVNQVSYTPQRAKNVTFSASYYNVNQAVVGVKGKPIATARSKADLRGYELGVQIGTTSYDYIVKNIKPTSKPAVYDTNNDAVTALKNGQIDGIVVDLPTAFYVTAVQVENGTIVGQFLSVGSQERFGLVFQKGNSLAGCVNKALTRMRADGTLKRLQTQWLSKATGARVLQ